jgi:hypothetical protein
MIVLKSEKINYLYYSLHSIFCLSLVNTFVTVKMSHIKILNVEFKEEMTRKGIAARIILKYMYRK